MSRLVIVVVAAIACTTPREAAGPRAVTQTAAPKMKLDRVVVPEVVVSTRPPHPPSIIVTGVVAALDKLHPPITAKYATGSIAATITTAVRERATTQRAYLEAHAARKADVAALAYDKLTKQRELLLALFAKHPRVLTADGALLHAILLTQRSEDRHDEAFERYLDSQRTSAPADEPVPDYAEAQAAIAAFVTRFPGIHESSARYVDAYTRERAAQTDDARRAAALQLLELARRTPASVITEASYHRAALVFADDPSPAGIARSREAFHWLADHSATPGIRIHALYRLGLGYAQARDPLVREVFCRLRAEPDPDARMFDDEADFHVARSFSETNDLQHLAEACAARRCPCTAPVLETLANDYLQDERDELARVPLEFAVEQFPASPNLPRTLCGLAQIHERANRSSEADKLRSRLPPQAIAGEPPCADGIPALEVGSTSEIVQRTIPRLRSLSRCFTHVLGRSGTLTLELTIATEGRVTSVHATGSTFDSRATDCVAAALQRHRWFELEQLQIVIPIRYVYE